MKKLLVLILLAFGFNSYAQNWNANRMIPGFQFNGIKIDSILTLPSDTVRNKRTNSIAILNGKFYYFNGIGYKGVTTSDSTYLTQYMADLRYQPLNSNTTLLGNTTTGTGSTIVLNNTPSISSPIIDGSNPYITFRNGSSVANAAGRMWYDSITGSWNLGMGGGNITQQIGEEQYWYGKASSAISDSPLQIVKQSGTVGSSGVIQFAPATAGLTNGQDIIGIATENIATNSFGRVTTFGIVHNITTNGTAYGETWTDGDIIWYNPSTGNPTKNKPTSPGIKVSVGRVIKAGSGGSGSFAVEIDHGSILGGTDSNVQFGTLGNNDLIVYDLASGYWKNNDATSIGLLKFSDTTSTISTKANVTALLLGKVSSVSASAPLSSTGGATPTISISQATTSTNGYLSSTDWNTFNGKQAALGYTPENAANKGASNGYAPLGSDIKIATTYLPSITMNNVFTAASQSAMLALSAVVGDMCVRTDSSISYVLQIANPSNPASWVKLLTPAAPVSSVNGFTGSVSLLTSNISEGGTSYYWTAARSRAAQSLTVSGSSGASTYDNITGVLNIPTYTLAGLGGQPQLNGTGFVKISGTTISYDNSTYLTGNQTITLSGDISGSGTTAITTTIGASKVTNTMLAGSIDYSKMNAATVPTWNQNTTGNAATTSQTNFSALTVGGTQVVTNNGSTWNIAILGNAATASLAANSTQWNGYELTFAPSTAPFYSMVYDPSLGKVAPLDLAGLKSWLGLGSAAYTSSAAYYASGSTVANSTLWNGYAFSFESGTPSHLMVWDGSTFKLAQSAAIQSFLGLGSYAYRSSGLAELSGATFTGDIGLGYNNNLNFGASPYRFRINRSSSGMLPVYFDDEYDNAASSVNFRMRTTGTPITALTILGSGNIGVNNANPVNAKLEVVATSGEVFRAAAAGGAYRIIADQTGVSIGGTLGVSGALTGTSATFSGGITQTGTYPSFIQTPSAWASNFILQSGVDITASSTGNYNASIVPTGKGWTWIVGGNGGTSVANLSSTGAATFASSVATGGDITINSTSAAALLNFQLSGTNHAYLGISSGSNNVINGSVLGDIVVRSTTNKSILFSVDNGSSSAFTIASTGALKASSLAGTGDRMVVANSIGVLSTQAIPSAGTSSTYTPSLFAASNVSSVTAESGYELAYYSRVGNLVTVWGTINVTPTTANQLTQVLFTSLPVSSTSTKFFAGTGSMITNAGNSVACEIIVDPAGNNAGLYFKSDGTALNRISYTFSYMTN